ncbi:SMI1/KNR4 family protein [Bacillus sp. SCS-151]|uniref:SMI1/KNR4 family protein n=1 Tax=Nanhaiella sioensis TaxID=3115293 RepID=UPI00397D98F7
MLTRAYKVWKADLENFLLRLTGGQHQNSLEIAHPATEDEIKTIEQQLGKLIPLDFRHVLLHFSKHLHFYWFLNNITYPITQQSNYIDKTFFNMGNVDQRIIDCGGIFDSPLWSIQNLLSYENDRETYEFLDDDDAFEKKYWENCLLFTSFGNGSYLGIDLKYNVGEIIYLTTSYHMHGLRLGGNFYKFFNNWIKLGCAGHWGEDFYLFSTKDKPYVNEQSVNATGWKKWIGII